MKSKKNKSVNRKFAKIIKKSSPSKKPIKINRVKTVAKSLQAAKIVNAVRNPVAKPIKIPSVEGMIDLITEAIQFKFKGDKTEPGITISKLRNGDVYISIVRFGLPFGKDKSVAYKARNETLMSSLLDIAQQITEDEIEDNPIDQLSKYLYTTSRDVSNIIIYDDTSDS